MDKHRDFLKRHSREHYGTEFLVGDLVFNYDTSVKLFNVRMSDSIIFYGVEEDFTLWKGENIFIRQCSTKEFMEFLKIKKKMKELNKLFHEEY